MKKVNKKDIAFYIFHAVCVLLSVYVFGLLRQLTGDPNTKMLTTVLVILLLTVLNITVLALHDIVKKLRK